MFCQHLDSHGTRVPYVGEVTLHFTEQTFALERQSVGRKCFAARFSVKQIISRTIIKFSQRIQGLLV